MATFSVLCIKEMFLYCPVSVQLLSRVQLFETPRTAVGQASLSITNSQVYSNSCPLSWWCHPTISSSVGPFSSHLQSFPASGSFPMSWLFTSGGQSIGASASVLPRNIQNGFPLGLTGLISLQCKGLSRVLIGEIALDRLGQTLSKFSFIGIFSWMDCGMGRQLLHKQNPYISLPVSVFLRLGCALDSPGKVF